MRSLRPGAHAQQGGVSLGVHQAGPAQQVRPRPAPTDRAVVLRSSADPRTARHGGELNDVHVLLARSASEGDQHPSLALRAKNHFAPGGTCFFSHANTSRCQYSLLRGFSTQCPSSGKLMKRDGTPWRCKVVKSWRPSLTGTRKSRSLWMISIGV